MTEKLIKISTFNVNSINARLPRLIEWIQHSRPDIILLQELKTIAGNFNQQIIADMGYNVAIVGQKSYNGVAIFSKFRLEDVIEQLPMIDEKLEQDIQARYVEALTIINGKAVRISSVYVPNGGGEIEPHLTIKESPKFLYKINFFDRLREHFKKLINNDEIQIIGGDFNVANHPIDVFDSEKLKETVCFHSLEQEKFRTLLNIGFSDSYRIMNPQKQEFSWWDYRNNSWNRNHGLRIDYLLTNPQANDCLINAELESHNVRDQSKASDHCPASITLKI
jgi:exodeoxyribonuclease-3